ncbi:hypothetical protein BGZ96_004225 [Linnemannia gamsii]|uniref:Uncharacterized protein n=1 Tax=Linnemannia gamsii TaxID=64522 RepID=A0ABQ7KHV0_9FUNG|nr:hypothetical protein BGZ96_004225 [Linnemannia gamsii]
MLVIYCKGLESFRQLEDKKPYHTPVTTDAILILLQGCPKLIVLDTPQHQIRAETLLASPPWASSRLETLRCMIVGVSRLSPDDIKILIELSVVGSSKNVFLTKQVRNALKTGRETMGQQQQVFKRLASLTHLKVLELAYRRPRDFRRESGQNIDHFTDTLELTLDSGLGQLAALKNLEMFGFEGCYHLIDRPELDWMVKSWPRLRVMCGLQQNDELTSGFEMRKRDMRSYMQQIRPDIQQHGGPRLSNLKEHRDHELCGPVVLEPYQHQQYQQSTFLVQQAFRSSQTPASDVSGRHQHRSLRLYRAALRIPSGSSMPVPFNVFN